MTQSTRRKITRVTVPLSALVVLASVATMAATGHPTPHLALAALFGLASIVTGLAYLRSSRER